jgi:hypothetical protein
MRSRLDVTTDNDCRHTIRSGGAGWKDVLISFINSVPAPAHESGDSPHAMSRLVLTTDDGEDIIIESEAADWAEVIIRFVENFSTGTKTPPTRSGAAVTSLIPDAPLPESLSVRERLELFLKYEYPQVWFTSTDIKNHYERVYDPINQSTVSTYLARMCARGVLERRGNRVQREYRVYETATIPEQVLPIAQSVN